MFFKNFSYSDITVGLLHGPHSHWAQDTAFADLLFKKNSNQNVKIAINEDICYKNESAADE